MAFATLSAATFHWSSSGIPTAASEGERKSAAAPGATLRLASTRAHRRSTSASCASSDTTSASGSRSRHRAKESSLHENTPKQDYRHYTNQTLILCRPDAEETRNQNLMPLHQRAKAREGTLDELG